MSLSEETWKSELEKPSGAFFQVFGERIQEQDGVRDAVRVAVKTLIPLLDWEAYLPHVPHGLMGLRAVFRLKPLLEEKSFRRILATQLHAFAHEGRRPGKAGLGSIGRGSGSWANVRASIASRRPSIAYGEMLGIGTPSAADFRALGSLVQSDMANVGHKAVMAHHLEDLFLALDEPKGTGRRMLALTAWLAATEPRDTFWYQRADKRMPGEALKVPLLRPQMDAEAHGEAAREICDLGLVQMLDCFVARIRQGASSGDLCAMLALAAAEKQLDARRDLEGKTAWNFTYLATHAMRQMEHGDPRHWAQCAALVNLFPTGEEATRVSEEAPRPMPADLSEGLLNAILDGEPAQAMFLCGELARQESADAVLRVLAEAASQNDPAFNHSHQILSVAATADLLPLVGGRASGAILAAVTKSLANSQGSADLGRLAEKNL